MTEVNIADTKMMMTEKITLLETQVNDNMEHLQSLQSQWNEKVELDRTASPAYQSIYSSDVLFPQETHAKGVAMAEDPSVLPDPLPLMYSTLFFHMTYGLPLMPVSAT